MLIYILIPLLFSLLLPFGIVSSQFVFKSRNVHAGIININP